MPTGLAIARNVVQDTGRWFVRLVGGALIVAALALVIGYGVARFWFWPRLDALATERVVGMEQRVGASIRWRELTTEWSGLRPSFEIRDLVIGDGDVASRADRVSATIALASLLRGQFGLDDLRIDRPVIVLANDAGGWRLAAQRPGSRPPVPAASGDPFQWLALAPQLRIGQGTIRLPGAASGTSAAGSQTLALDGIDLVLRTRGRLHDLRIDIARPDRLADRLALHADLLRPRNEALADWRQWEGTVRLQGRSADPAAIATQLAGWIPGWPAIGGRWPWQGVVGRLDPDLRVAFRDGIAHDGRLAIQSGPLRVPLAPTSDRFVDLAQANVDLRWSQVGAVAERGDVRPDARPEGPASPSWRFELPVLMLRGPAARPGGGEVLSIVGGERGVVIDADARLQRVERARIDLVEATLAAPAAWAKAWWPGLERLEALAGTARDAQVDWSDDGRWRVAGRVERAAFQLSPSAFERAHPLAARIPGGRDVDLVVEASQAGGRATLSHPRSGGAAMLQFGGVLVEPELAFNELDARIGWALRPAASADPAATPRLRVEFDQVRFANADLAGRFGGRYESDGLGNGDGQVVINGSVDRVQARRVHRYLPYAVAPPARDWLAGAFESGQLDTVRFQVDGRLHAFPYRGDERGQGKFHLTGRYRDMLLRFAPGWPTIQQATGDFSFDGAGLQVNGDSGGIGSTRLEAVTATIADLAQPELVLRGSARGDANDLVRFVNASPLAASGVGNVTRPLRAEGPAQLRLAVDLPLADPRPARIDGQLELNGMRLAFDPNQPTFTDVRGRLDFTGRSLSFKAINARLYGSPVETDGHTDKDGSLVIEARSRMSADTLRALTDNSLTRQLDGAADVQVSMRFADDSRTVRAESDLVGLASRLPAPLAKSAAEARPLRFEWVPAPDAARPTERIEATLDGGLRMRAERSAVDRGRPLVITRAAVAQGREPQLPPRGLALQATLPRIDGDAWLAVFDGPMTPVPPISAAAAPSGASAPAGSSAGAGGGSGGAGLFAEDFSAEPAQVSLMADEVRYGNRLYRKVTLEGTRTGRVWNARLQSTEVAGTVQWEAGGPAGADGKLVGRFARLAIPNAIEGTRPLPTDREARMPALDIVADNLAIGDARLGRLELVATQLRSPAVWRLDRLDISSPAGAFRAGGKFRESTELDYELQINNAGKLLEQFGLRGVVRDGSGQMRGKLRWQSVPSNFDIPTLSGEVKIDIRDGQFLKVEPGAAKLIGVLNLQVLPKLLKLDFADLFARGFAFQELSGDVRIDSGVARADNLAMRGLEAVVQMQGQADLRRQTQDVHVTILPNLDAGLAALAYAAIVNPAVGLGAFLAQSLLGKQLSRAFAHEIDIRGPWDQPQVITRQREPAPGSGTGG